ncbi:SH3 domain-containing protein, partial [Haemophilus influenzae]
GWWGCSRSIIGVTSKRS